MIRCALLVLSLWLPLSVPAVAQTRQLDLFSVGAGDLGGGYYAAARAICEAYNRDGPAQSHCSPESTSGSLYNLKMLREGELEFALTQSDWQRAAQEGTRGFARAGPMGDLRGVVSLYPEAVTILAAPASAIRAFDDLDGKRVDIGLPASGRNATVRSLLDLLGPRAPVFAETIERAPFQAAEQLCEGALDAAIFVVGHPDTRIAALVESCGVRIVPLAGPAVDAVLADAPQYVRYRVRGGLYRDHPAPVPTLAVYATLVTRAGYPAPVVRELTATILSNAEALAARAPVLEAFNPGRAAQAGMTAPLHPGAEAAYRAAGLLPE